ncbi:hypothetical protein [Kamptonema sp. UHCC 0994]|uniref:hypothetical protein n=1 Tax=Kamptonema sp. UHCC 0994 TaxID=3031329 RepID=UPI0023B96761|nr:hypothetical protein [Kamptonema sp. UHCC 0994]MDF0553398.1 hypothetical protein [Kamptonema sp. UHCC 0994]
MAPIVPIAGGLIIRGTASLVARAAGAGLARAAGAAAAGRLGSITVGTVGGNFLTDWLKKFADWIGGVFTQEDEAAKPTPVHEAQFATLDIRADPVEIQGLFGVSYPLNVGVINTRQNTPIPPPANQPQTQTKVEVVGAKAVGFWAVHIEVTEFDEKILNSWKHPLQRRNFGFITFCRGGVAIQDSPIHYANQIISIPITRALAEGCGGAEISSVAVDYVCGNLAEGVKATISFLPIWDVFSYDYVKQAQPP